MCAQRGVGGGLCGGGCGGQSGGRGVVIIRYKLTPVGTLLVVR